MMKKLVYPIFLILLLFDFIQCENEDLYNELHCITLPELSLKSFNLADIDQLEIVFTYNVIKESAETIANYSIYERGNPENTISIQEASMDEENPNKLFLDCDVFTPETEYEIRIDNLLSTEAQITNPNGIVYNFTVPLMMDLSRVTLFEPKNGEITTSEPVFLWSSRTGATKYTLQIASDSEFSSLIADIQCGDNYYELKDSSAGYMEGNQSLDAITYYWRVKPHFAEREGEYSLAEEFNVIKLTQQESAVYVDYAYSGETYGNKSHPFKNIKQAIDFADYHGIQRVNVAQGYYSEDIVMVKDVSLYGGYDSADWSRDLENNDTHLSPLYSNIAVIFPNANIDRNTCLDGFLLIASDVFAHIETGILCINSAPVINNNEIHAITGIKAISGSNPIISNNKFYSSSDIINKYGVLLLDNSYGEITDNTMWLVSGGDEILGVSVANAYDEEVLIEGNAIVAQTATLISACIFNKNSNNLKIYNNTLSEGDWMNAQSTYGIYNETCEGEIIGNKIYGGSGIQEYGIYNRESDFLIANNIISPQGHLSSATDTFGIYSAIDSCCYIYNNTINAGKSNGATNIAIYFDEGIIPATYHHIANNVLFAQSTTNSYCLYAETTTRFDTIKNNNFFECSTYYHDGSIDTSNMSTIITTGEGSQTLSYWNNLSEDLTSSWDSNFYISGDLSGFSFDTAGINGAHSTNDWGFTTDINGDDRSPLDDSSENGWSIGVYEYN